jgi:malonyl-CoA O-methyltransferase
MPPADHDDYFLDPRLVRRAFDRASATFDANAAVHTELRTRLLERLDVVKITPEVVVDLGAGTGHATRALQDRYRQAQVIAVDLSIGMLRHARQQQRFLKRFGRVASDAQALGLKNASTDLIFSNLMLHWCSDPDRVFQELARVLKPGGLLTFTALGPDSLRELRSAWAANDAKVHVHRFIDMHDVGDALMRAGFAEPVMDTERLTVTYRDPEALLRELRGSGSTNLALGRLRGLRSTLADRAARSRLDALRKESVVPITLEVVYGHAWAPLRPAAKRTDPTSFGIPVDKIGRR